MEHFFMRIVQINDDYIKLLRNQFPGIMDEKRFHRSHTRKYVGVIFTVGNFNYWSLIKGLFFDKSVYRYNSFIIGGLRLSFVKADTAQTKIGKTKTCSKNSRQESKTNVATILFALNRGVCLRKQAHLSRVFSLCFEFLFWYASSIAKIMFVRVNRGRRNRI